MTAEIAALVDAYRVVHEHASGPVGRDDLKGMLRR